MLLIDQVSLEPVTYISLGAPVSDVEVYGGWVWVVTSWNGLSSIYIIDPLSFAVYQPDQGSLRYGATRIAVSDITVPREKQVIIGLTQEEVDRVEQQYRRGLITEEELYNKTVELFSRQIGVVKLIIAIIIVLSISNTMTMNVMERTVEIGTAMALGVRRQRILMLFLLEGLLDVEAALRRLSV